MHRMIRSKQAQSSSHKRQRWVCFLHRRLLRWTVAACLIATHITAVTAAVTASCDDGDVDDNKRNDTNNDNVDDEDLFFFTKQVLGSPFAGQHVGVAVADLNGDGLPDLVFAAGRHWIDQPFALINLGTVDVPVVMSVDGNTTVDGKTNGNGTSHGTTTARTTKHVRFSKPLPLGRPSGYYQVDVLVSPPLVSNSDAMSRPNAQQPTQVSVLLAGGTCHVTEVSPLLPPSQQQQPQGGMASACTKGTNFPAVLLDVVIHGCMSSVSNDTCTLQWKEVWRDPDPQGDRNGAFALLRNNDNNPFPAIVLVGQGGVAVHVWNSTTGAPFGSSSTATEPSTTATTKSSLVHQYRHAPPHFTLAQTDGRSDRPRYAGLAVQQPRPGEPLVVAVGPRSDFNRPPNPILTLAWEYASTLLGTTNDSGSTDCNATVHNDTVVGPTTSLGGEAYAGNPRYALQASGLAWGDLDGDGVDDLAEANYLYPNQIVDGFPLPQRVYLTSSLSAAARSNHSNTTSGTNDNGVYTVQTLLDAPQGGRSVAIGQIFQESSLPDVAFATAVGEVILFANLGLGVDTDENGSLQRVFLGFARRHSLHIGPKCQIRDLAIVNNLAGSCSVSIACAVTCGNGPAHTWNGNNDNSGGMTHEDSGNVVFHGSYGHKGSCTESQNDAYGDGSVHKDGEGDNSVLVVALYVLPFLAGVSIVGVATLLVVLMMKKLRGYVGIQTSEAGVGSSSGSQYVDGSTATMEAAKGTMA